MGANRIELYPVSLGQRTIAESAPPRRIAPMLTRLETPRYPGRIHLTPRERQVLALLAEGLPNKLICRRLGIAPSTVKIHVARILAELGVATRLQAVLTAQRCGLLAEPLRAERRTLADVHPDPHGGGPAGDPPQLRAI